MAEKPNPNPNPLATALGVAVTPPAPVRMTEVVALQAGIVVKGALVDDEIVNELPVGKVASVPWDVFARALAPHRGLVTTPEAYEAKQKAIAAHDKAMEQIDKEIVKHTLAELDAGIDIGAKPKGDGEKTDDNK